MMSYFQDGSHGVILHRIVLPPGQCTCSICSTHSAASASSCLVHTTCVLVISI